MHFQMTYSTEKNGTYSISLIKHVLLHNGEKHYACSRCDKTLKHRNDLKNTSWNVIWCFRAHLLRQVSHFEFCSFLRKGSWQLSLNLDTKTNDKEVWRYPVLFKLSFQNFTFMSNSLLFQSIRYVILHDGKINVFSFRANT